MRPRLITPRTPHTRTDGPLGGFVARLHSRPWKPFHRAAAAVIGEKLPDGRYRFPVVVVLFPRQCGKTTTVLDLALGRALTEPDYRAAYTAQTGHKTTENLTARISELEAGPLAGVVKLRRSAGTERVTFPTRSYLKAFPPLAGALRSDALDLVIVDEAQEHDDILGAQLDQTIIPTFTTRPRRQLIVVGTAGTDRSGYLRRYLDKARAGDPGFAVVEYGAPDDVDFTDPACWPVYHPGLAYGLTDTAALAQGLEVMGPAGFSREYGNQWTRTSVRVFDPESWTAAQLPTEAPRPAGRVCLAVHVEADRSAAAITAAILQPDGRPYVEVVQAEPGTDWCVPRLLELQGVHRAPVALDRYGAVGTVADALELAGADLLTMKTMDVANAAAGFLDLVTGGGIDVYPSLALSEAVEGAAQRPLADTNGFAWSHRASSAPIAPLVASCAAVWGLARLAPELRPVLDVG